MAHDVFISYSSKDKPVADAVCATLEGRKVRCWVAPRDVLPGLPYGEAIVDALEGSRVLVLVFSASANDSPQVMREVERAVSKGIPIIPLRIEAIRPSKSLEYFISAPHWLDALTPPLAKHLQPLGETVQLLLARTGQRAEQREAEPARPANRVVPPTQAPLPSRTTTKKQPATAAPAPKPLPKPTPRKHGRSVFLVVAIAALVALPAGVCYNMLHGSRADPAKEIASGTGMQSGDTQPSATKPAPPGNSKAPGDEITNDLGMRFAWIPPGKFRMGSDQGDDEKPVHWVTITKGFYMGVYPVTQAEWKKVMDNDNPSTFKGDELPVETVSWGDCQKFCDALKKRDGRPYRLPTEAEWEYACRAGTTTDYNTGDGEDALKRAGWYEGNSDGKTHPVGQKEKSRWGLYDMHGNVWQWCADYYGPYKYFKESDPVRSDKDDTDSRILRGGSWYNVAAYCRAAGRDWRGPGNRGNNCGLRACFRLD